jgi:UDP-N-acetylmuramate dehydrogenase
LNVTAQAGATTAQIAKYAKDNSLKGAEFLSVIPASIGGACYMNAGCFGYNISGIVTKIVATRGEGLVTFSKEECDFGYRTSRFQKEGWVICEITMRFEKGEKEYIKMLMNSLWAKKATTQPLGERTAGSVFLNKDSYYAAQLIEETGLKGFRLGNAQVSAKHSNFIVSHGATQREISNLIEVIKYAVKEKTGIILEQEIKFLGD